MIAIIDGDSKAVAYGTVKFVEIDGMVRAVSIRGLAWTLERLINAAVASSSFDLRLMSGERMLVHWPDARVTRMDVEGELGDASGLHDTLAIEVSSATTELVENQAT